MVIRYPTYCTTTDILVVKFFSSSFVPPIPKLPSSPAEEPAGEPGQGEESWPGRDRGREQQECGLPDRLPCSSPRVICSQAQGQVIHCSL